MRKHSSRSVNWWDDSPHRMPGSLSLLPIAPPTPQRGEGETFAASGGFQPLGVVEVLALRELRPRSSGRSNVVKRTPCPSVPSPDAALGDGVFAARKLPPPCGFASGGGVKLRRFVCHFYFWACAAAGFGKGWPASRTRGDTPRHHAPQNYLGHEFDRLPPVSMNHAMAIDHT